LEINSNESSRLKAGPSLVAMGFLMFGVSPRLDKENPEGKVDKAMEILSD
jgi:hypothetical protein